MLSPATWFRDADDLDSESAFNSTRSATGAAASTLSLRLAPPAQRPTAAQDIGGGARADIAAAVAAADGGGRGGAAARAAQYSIIEVRESIPG